MLRRQVPIGQVVSNLPTVLLRTSPHATREGCGAAEAPADGYGHFHHNSPLRKTQEAADQVLHERPEACLCEMYREGTQTPHHSTDREGEEQGQGETPVLLAIVFT